MQMQAVILHTAHFNDQCSGQRDITLKILLHMLASVNFRGTVHKKPHSYIWRSSKLNYKQRNNAHLRTYSLNKVKILKIVAAYRLELKAQLCGIIFSNKRRTACGFCSNQ